MIVDEKDHINIMGLIMIFINSKITIIDTDSQGVKFLKCIPYVSWH
ncbi:hypothetical protein PROSTU_04297 [Providencia stuartii ATCC 25827]|uniref:Uncharacterized protein n=1 Tax=Providencia stuartii ATCC 25827 TaxID=471874 RepID=A0AA86YF73_PROST|nr:hypothetical protein PROSTU_04297 [Providencia stuartii ATCC 25827]